MISISTRAALTTRKPFTMKKGAMSKKMGDVLTYEIVGLCTQLEAVVVNEVALGA